MSNLNHQPKQEPNQLEGGAGETFTQVMERRLSRRGLLKGLATASAAAVTISVLGQAGSAEAAEAPAEKIDFVGNNVQTRASLIGLNVDEPVVAPGYVMQTLLRWGDPVVEGAPEFTPDSYTAAAQETQFGYNCDFVGFMPIPFGSDSSDHGLLVVNHEYTNSELMFAGYDPEAPEPDQNQVISS